MVDEVRKVRAEHAARFGFDLEAIYRDLKEKERTSGRAYVRYPPRRIAPQEGDWREHDRQDLTAFSLEHASRIYPWDENLA